MTDNESTGKDTCPDAIEDRPSGPRSRVVSIGLADVCKSSPSRRRKSASLPPETVEYLKNWIMSPDHIAHPYPTEQEKSEIMRETGIEMKQLTNWFVNNRKRYWKPRVEARLREQQLKVSRAKGPSPVEQTQLTNLSLGDVVSALSAKQAPAVSPSRRVISAQSSVASGDSSDDCMTSDEVSDASVRDNAVEDHLRKETVDIQILQPVVGMTPSLEDVSTDSDLPSDRLLRSFTNCDLQFRCSARSGRKVQRARDVAITILKKECLQQFVDERAAHALASRKRKVTEFEPVASFPRPKYRRRSLQLWREACQTADHGYDHQLPSLEEAATLFGFSVATQ